MRIFGAGPSCSVSHSVGAASSSPSVSRPVISAITVGGSAAGSRILRPRLATVPSSASSRRICLSSTRSAFFKPNSRAISRVPILPGFARMKATMASRLGKPLSCFLFTYPRALPALFFAGGLDALAFAPDARMLAERLAGVGAETTAARTLGNFFGDQCHRAVEADVEHLVAGFEARIGLLVAHERAEAADTGGDRLAGFRMLADLARQR